jgi:hypothetical protein
MKKINYEWNFNDKISSKINTIYESYLDRQDLVNDEEFLINKIEIVKIAYIQMYKEILIMLHCEKIEVSGHRDRKLIKLLREYLLNDFNLMEKRSLIFN